MVPKPKFDWKPEFKLAGGLKFFTDRVSRRWAIADASGPTPEATDNGVLWIDFTNPIRIGNELSSLPVRNDEGTLYTVPLFAPDAVWLARRLDMRVCIAVKVSVPPGSFVREELTASIKPW